METPTVNLNPESSKSSAAPGVAPQPSATYTAQDVDAAGQVGQWLRERGQSRSWLGKKTRISSSTISQVLNGKYPASPTSYLDQMLAVLQVETERMGDGTPGYVEGSVHKLAVVVCDRTRKHANFGVLCGHVGVGKTRSLKEYKARKPQTLLVEANPAMTAGSLLIELLGMLGAAVPPGMDRKFDAVVKAIKGTNYLLIVDEAENLSSTALHYLRRIRDKAEVGVVLAGTEKLHTLLKPEHGQFDQIRSRVSMWPETIKGISRDDMDDMAREALAADVKDVADEVLDALWEYCGGSARVLMESLIPALRDYGLGRNPLNAKLVEAIAGKVLFMQKRSQIGRAHV
jgi:DNA transposition AAA+ family ATPase